MASPERAKNSTPASSGSEGDDGVAAASVPAAPMNGSKTHLKPHLKPSIVSSGSEGGGDPKPEATITQASEAATESRGDIPKDGPISDNIQPESGGSTPENNNQSNETADEASQRPENGELTVIDGPLAKGGVPDEGSTGGTVGGTVSQATPTVASHTPNSSMGSSLGELLGESHAALLENGTEHPGINMSPGRAGSELDLVSTEKPGKKGGHHKQGEHKGDHHHPLHVSSKSTSDMADQAVAAGTEAGEKPPLKHLASSPPDSGASAFQRARSPQKPMVNRERVNSSQDFAELNKADTTDDDDDDDEDENDIPPHIQSKIVEKSPAERYIRFKEKLGSGAYKDVYRAYDTIEGIEVAWNVVRLSGVPKAERVRIVNEVRLLERLHHPNIISFHGSWVNRETERVIFVTEILSSGTLKSFVQKVQLIRWKIFKRWAIQILQGLVYLHSQDPPIIHRDLKCDNIFINGTSGDLRIGDFGLSTAISKKNQPLSVLGTPEFMAPELYDESYNEKVDIYAFGMLLLEIITRDVPYHECANPAQIYKKVTQGIPPSSLRRVKSVDARNFILLCLGIGQDASERPSASDLLKHEFLTKKIDDEATIEVEPAVEDMVIQENRDTSMTFSDTGSEKSLGSRGKTESGTAAGKNNKYASSIDGHEIPSRGAGAGSPSDQQGGKSQGKPPRSDTQALTASKSKSMESKDTTHTKAEGMAVDEHADDHFGGMPEDEASMKKVTVLMGRGTTLDEEASTEPPAKEMEVVSLSSTPPPDAIKLPKPAMPRSTSEAETSSLGSMSQYKVSAVTPAIEGGGNIKPYGNDVINLALTLPDESQTTIEFEFDLVNDDPVQVAREMVTELDEVPDDAVLDISEAISGVARQARMKQNQWTKLQQQQQIVLAQQQALQQQQHQQQHQQQTGMMMHPQGSVPMQPSQGLQGPQGTIMMPQQHMYGSGFAPMGGFQNPGGSLVQPQLSTPGGDPSVMGGPTSTSLQAQQQQQTQSQMPTPQPPQHNHVSQGQPPPHPPPPPAPSQMSTPQPTQQMATPQLQQPMSTPQPTQQMATPQLQQQMSAPQPTQQMATQQLQQQMSAPQLSNQHQMHAAMSHQSASVPSSPAPPIPQSAQVPPQQQYPSQPQQPTMVRSSSMDISSLESLATPGVSPQVSAQQSAQPQQPMPPQQPQLPTSVSNSSQETITPRQMPTPVAAVDSSVLQNQNAHQGASSSSVPQKQHVQMPLHDQTPQVVARQESSGEGEMDTEEIRRLEQEFEKKMQRAKKSYGTRMDNLHRSKVESEAQHQMTLEKHEKERIEFEKRVRLAEEEQTRRLNQIQKEYIEKKKEARQQRSKQPSAGVGGMQMQNGNVGEGSGGIGGCSRPPLHGGHKRSSSHFEASMSMPATQSSQTHQHQQGSPMISEHKRISSMSDLTEDASPTLLDPMSHPQQQIQQPPRSGPPNLPKPQRQASAGGNNASASVRDRSGSTSS